MEFGDKREPTGWIWEFYRGSREVISRPKRDRGGFPSARDRLDDGARKEMEGSLPCGSRLSIT
jgi:hypothetical protein